MNDLRLGVKSTLSAFGNRICVLSPFIFQWLYIYFVRIKDAFYEPVGYLYHQVSSSVTLSVTSNQLLEVLFSQNMFSNNISADKYELQNTFSTYTHTSTSESSPVSTSLVPAP